MRKRSTIKQNSNGRHWLIDGVTKLNALLIKNLKEHLDIDNAWYFNGRVYGENDGLKMMFDLFDEVEDKIRTRGNDNSGIEFLGTYYGSEAQCI